MFYTSLKMLFLCACIGILYLSRSHHGVSGTFVC